MLGLTTQKRYDQLLRLFGAMHRKTLRMDQEIKDLRKQSQVRQANDKLNAMRAHYDNTLSKGVPSESDIV